MRVVHVIQSMRIDRGGPVTVVAELARAQARAGIRVSVAHCTGASTASDLTALAQRWQGLEIEAENFAQAFRESGWNKK